jgi:hypothetical protein
VFKSSLDERKLFTGKLLSGYPSEIERTVSVFLLRLRDAFIGSA